MSEVTDEQASNTATDDQVDDLITTHKQRAQYFDMLRIGGGKDDWVYVHALTELTTLRRQLREADTDELVYRLASAGEAFKSFPTAGPQTVGFEQYRGVISGFQLSAIREAAHLLRALKELVK